MRRAYGLALGTSHLAAKKMPPQRVANARNKKADPGSTGMRAIVMREGGGCARLRHENYGYILCQFFWSMRRHCLVGATSDKKEPAQGGLWVDP